MNLFSKHRHKFVLAFALFILTSISTSLANAQTNYYVSTTGSDSNNGAQATPWKTIQHAIETVSLSGAVVINVAPGVYGNPTPLSCQANSPIVCIDRDGVSPSARLTLQCQQQWNTSSTAGCRLRQASGISTFIQVNANNIIVNGFDAGNNAAANQGIQIGCYPKTPASGQCVTGNNVRIINNYVHELAQTADDAGHGPGCPANGAIFVGHNGALLPVGDEIIGNRVYYYGDWAGQAPINGGACTFAHDIYASANTVIQNNVLLKATSNGIQLYNSPCTSIITNNTIAKSGTNGIQIAGGTSGCTSGIVTVTNNILDDNGRNGILIGTGTGGECDSTHQILISNNNTSGNGGSPYSGTSGCSIPLNQTTEAPTSTFVNYTGGAIGDDFHLKSTSAIKSAGTSACVSSGQTPCVPATDFDNVVRSVSGAQSIGAYVLVSGSSPAASFSPSPIDFGASPIGVPGNSVTATLRNAGTASLTFSNPASISGTNATDFVIQSTTCTSPLSAGNSCTYILVFTPSATGNRSANLTLTDNAAGSPHQLPLTGSGGAPGATFSPSSLNFGLVALGSSSAIQVSTITSSGSAALNLTAGATITGSNPGDFTFGGTGTCNAPSTLAQGASCSISIKFTPTAAGSRSAIVSQATNAAGSPQTFTVTGTGGAASVSLTPSSFAFGNIQVGTASAAHTFVLSNTGTAPLTFTITTSSAAFAQGNTCVSPLAPSASCNINVTFQPMTAGAASAFLTVTSNAASSPNTSSLTGTGTAPAGVSLAPSTINFPNTLLNSYSAVTNITLTNPSLTAVTINGISLAGANPTDFIVGACSTSGAAFVDNFNAGSLDLSKWQIDTGSAPGTISNLNSGTFSASNVDLSQGVLGLKVVQSGASPVTSVGAEIRSLNAFGFGTYRWRMRAASSAVNPYAAGTTASGQISSTFTLNGSTANPYTEVDSPEIEGQHPNTIEWTSWTTPSLNTSVSTTLANPEAAFHTYGFNWQAASIVFSLDGSVVATNTTNIPTVAANPMINLWGTNSTSFGGLATLGTRWMYVAGFAFTPAGVTSVPAGGSCTIPVIFNPQSSGSKAATVQVSDSSTGSPHQATIGGLGTAPTATISGSPAAFGNQPVGTTSVTKNLTLANTGNGPMWFSIALTGSNPDQFILSTTSCVSPMAGGQSCLIPLQFKPTTAASSTATITVTDSASGSPHTGTVTGTGTALTVSISPSSLTFPSTTVGVTSSAIVAMLTNTGNTTLNIASRAVTGDYAISASTCGSTLAAGASCTVSVTFTPTATGTRPGTLVFTDDAINSPQSIGLTGTGTAATAPVVLLSPANLNFGSQVISTLSTAQVVTLTNTGTATLNMVRSISGDYSISATTCGATLGTSASCTISVKFTPTALGARGGLLTFTDDASGSPQTVGLTGNGVSAPAPIATVSPSSLTFSSQTVGTTSASQAITVQNTGNATLNIASILATGNYAVSSTTCGATLAASASCVVNVTFSPTATGTRSGAINITDDATGSPQAVTLSGTGTAVTAPIASLSVSSLTFGSQTTGTTSTPRTVTLTNTGNATLNIASIASNGDFTIFANTCGSTLAISASCVVSLTFTPTATGTRNGSLTFVDNAAGSPHLVLLSGTGTAPTFPTVSIAPSSLGFGNQVISTGSATQNVTLTNTGTGTLNIGTIAPTGDFSVTSTTCGSTLAPSIGCTITVRFTPSALGPRTGVLSFTDNAAGSPQTISLTGAGVPAPEPIASLSPTSLSFANTFVGVTTAAKDITLTNSGNATLNIASIIASGDYARTTTCGGTLAAAASCVIHVTFTPTAAGTRAGAINVTDDATGSPQSIPLSGIGINTVSSACLSTTSLNFGNQPVNTNSGTRPINITNCGTAGLSISSINSSVSNLDEYTDSGGTTNCEVTTGGVLPKWCWQHDAGTPGTAVGTSAIVTSPSLDGHSRQYVSTFTGFGGLRWSLSFLPRNDLNSVSTAYTFDVQARIENLTHVNQIELDMNQVMPDGRTVIYGVQCNLVVGFWQYTIATSPTTSTWVSSTIPCTRVIWTAAVFHHVVIKHHRDASGVVTYDSVSFDGATTAFTNASGGSAFTLGWTPVGLNLVNFQLDGDNTSNTLTAYLDEFSVSTTAFTQTNNCTLLVPNAFCTINAMFSPVFIGSIGGQFRIVSNSTTSPDHVSLSGFGTTSGGVLTPTSVNFGSVNVGSPSAISTLTFQNTGNTSVSLAAPVMSGTNPSDFTVQTSCGTVAPNGSCALGVIFTPGGAGARSGTLSQPLGSGSITVSLSGTGVAIAPIVAFSPATIDFGNNDVASTSALKTIQLSNTGTTTLNIASVVATGADAADFTVSNHCSATVIAGGVCTIDVSCTPSLIGGEVAAVTVTDDAAGSPHAVGLACNGTAAPAPRVQPGPTGLTFPSTQVGLPSGAQVMTVTNLGNAPLIFSSITLGGSNPGDFAITSGTNCTTVAAGATCGITINFIPTAAGSRSATVILTDNASGSPQSAAVSGTAFAGTPNLLVPISTIDFGNLVVGTTSSPVIFSLTNQGNATATVTFAIGGNFAESDTCNGSIPASTSCSVTLTFLPTDTGAWTGALSIFSNTVNSPQSIALTGVGIPQTPPPGPIVIGMGGKAGQGGNAGTGVQ